MWQDHPVLAGEGYCDGYGENVTSELLEEANSATHCGGYYKTYGRYDADGRLINVTISNGNCEAAAEVFRNDPPEPLDEHCQKYGGTGNFRWTYVASIQPFGGYGTQGVTCEVEIEGTEPQEQAAGWRYDGYDQANSRWDDTAYLATSGDLVEAWSVALDDSFLYLRSGDVNGDGLLELVAAGDRNLHLFDSTGQALIPPIARSNGNYYPILEDLDNDGTQEILVGVRNTSSLNIAVYSGDGTLEQTIPGRSGGRDSYMFPLAYLGNDRLLAGYTTGYALKPRGFARFTLGDFPQEDWHYEIGAGFSYGLCRDRWSRFRPSRSERHHPA
ncbi:VCBS repeat-containing protein [Lamprobacter modestohalophilus]|uniref:FG-GAP repeat domain-containing protein n=1 Tax=Lamprobacter modestohalophilus TaxID=1064514 RepID=UPI002ADEC432|nr:VCBS repeat-containing protein [Lamprobacter modestohalophilus]MEA1053159.1 VCBS repeat-containing protein [Lamprobacter modestohalophilus]